MKLFKKKITITGESTVEIEAVETWVVDWWSRYDKFSTDTKRTIRHLQVLKMLVVLKMQ